MIFFPPITPLLVCFHLLIDSAPSGIGAALIGLKREVR